MKLMASSEGVIRTTVRPKIATIRSRGHAQPERRQSPAREDRGAGQCQQVQVGDRVFRGRVP